MDDIRPFRIAIPDADLDDLRERLRRTRWLERECVGDWSQGVPLDYVRELAEYWGDGCDWRTREERLNRFDQFVTEVDGLDIHFIHRRSPNPNAIPLVMTHGWPGSIAEFTKVIEPLSRDFHVVCPSLPGYGFSGKPAATGWTIQRIAAAWGHPDDTAGLWTLRGPGRRLGCCGHHADRPERLGCIGIHPSTCRSRFRPDRSTTRRRPRRRPCRRSL